MAGYLFQLIFRKFKIWRLRRVTTLRLSCLSDHLLRDIGLDRSEIVDFVDGLCQDEKARWLANKPVIDSSQTKASGTSSKLLSAYGQQTSNHVASGVRIS